VSKLRLPDVTLLAVDGGAHELTRMALETCLKHADFGAVVTFSDKQILPGAEWHLVEAPNTAAKCDRVTWYDVPPVLQTSHFLLVQFDSWVIHPQCWTNDFLKFDYIGAPWWRFDEEYNVGNGGFSLRSTRLARHLAEHPTAFPLKFPEDDTLCRVYAPELEKYGFKFARSEDAMPFSFERIFVPDMDGARVPTFGYHGMFNWPYVLTDDEIAERLFFAPDFVLKHLHFRQMNDELNRLERRPCYRPARSKVYAA
jgi:hypothetical protein